MRPLLVLLVVTVALSLTTGGAAAATWLHASAPGVNSTTSDPDPWLTGPSSGWLFVEHMRPTNNTSQYVSTTASANAAKYESSTSVFPEWTSLTENPGLAVDLSGTAHLLFGGIHSTDSADPLNDGKLHSATGIGGVPWTLDAGTQTTDTANKIDEFAAGRMTVSGGVATPAFVWTGPSGTVARLGLDGSPETVLQAGCCTYDPGIAVTYRGSELETWALWYSQGSGITGLRAQRVYPTPSAVEWLPGSSNADHTLGIQPQMHIRTNNGYVAYCTGYPACTTVRLYNLVTHSNCKVATGTHITSVAVGRPAVPMTSDWVSWHDGAVIKFAAVNRVTCLLDSPVQAITPPKTAQGVNGSIFIMGTHLWANLTIDGVSSMWTTPIFPEPAVTPPAPTQPGAIARVKVVVVGLPARKATLRLFGTTWRASTRGVIAVRVPSTTRAGSYRGFVRLAGATPAPVAVRVRR